MPCLALFVALAAAYGDGSQGSGFRAGYGYEKGAQLISRDGHSLFTNRLIPPSEPCWAVLRWSMRTP